MSIGDLGEEMARHNAIDMSSPTKRPEDFSEKGKTVTAKITGYTSIDPGVGFITYTGTRVRWGTVAVDPKYIPLGSKIWIEGFEGTTFIAEDIGGAVKGWHVDIWVGEGYVNYVPIYTRNRTVTSLPPN